MELVGTALGDGVDGTTGESALAYVERSHGNLNLLDGLHRYRLSTCLTTIVTAGCQTEDVIVCGTVNHEVVVAVVDTGERHVAGIGNGELWVQSSHVSDTVGNARHVVDLLCRHTGSSTGT